MRNNLPLTCLDSRWLSQAPWFHHADGRVVRAGLLLLTAAWDADPAAHLNDDDEVLALSAGLPVTMLRAHRALLLAGFAPIGRAADGRPLLRHEAMHEIVRAVEDRFGEQVQAIAAASTLACLAPAAEFELSDVAGKARLAKRSAGKGMRSKLRDDFQPDEAGWGRARASGYVAREHQEWLLQRFLAVFQARNELKASWDKTWLNFVDSAFTARDFLSRFGMYPRDCLRAEGARPLLPGAGGAPAGRATFSALARQGNLSVMDAVLRTRGYAAQEQQEEVQHG